MYNLFQQSNANQISDPERKVLFKVLNSITDGFHYMDNDWNVLFWNKAAEKIVTCKAELIINKNLWEVFSDARDSKFFIELSRCKQMQEPVEFESHYEPLDLHVEVKAYPSDKGIAVYFKDITAKKKLTLEIENQKKQQEAIINATSDVIWSIDKDFRLLVANTAFRENVKKYSNKVIKEGDAILELMSLEEGEKWRPLYERALKGESYKHDQAITYETTGEWNYIEICFNPIFDEKSYEVRGVACHSRDITASKRYISLIEDKNKKLQAKEQRLQEITNNLEAILNNSIDIIASTSKDGHYVTMNKACFYITGYTPEELIGKSFSEIVHPDDVQKTIEMSANIREGFETTAFRNRIIRKNGGVVHMIWSARWDEKRQLVYSVGRDATALYDAENKIAASEQRFSALISKGADMIGIIDEAGNYKYVSSNVERVLGYSVNDLLGKRAFDLIHPDDIECIASEFEKVLTTNEAHIGEFRFKDGSGNWRWIEVICTNMIHNEAIKGLIINSRDITERKQHEEKLQQVVLSLYQQNNALKEIAFIQSHEVRRPLANILGLIEIIIGFKLKPEQQTAIAMLKRSGQELDAMIRKIVSTSYHYTSSLVDNSTDKENWDSLNDRP